MFFSKKRNENLFHFLPVLSTGAILR